MYYPLSEITENLYTAGSEFVDLVTGKPYVGYYFSTTDGKYFSGKTNNNSAREIIKAQQSVNTYLVQPSEHYLPNPNDADYEKGFIIRYIIKRVNSGEDTIKEVSKEEYDRLKNNPLYNRVELEWKITGRIFDDLSNMLYPIYGVSSTNRMKINQLEPKIPGISKVFKNYTEFAR